MSYFYQAYNLVFKSEILLPELTKLDITDSGDIKADVIITYGNVDGSLADPLNSGVIFQTNENTFLLNLENIARYLVRDGREIIIDPAEGADQNDIRVFMLGSVFGAMLHQRRFLVLHASAVHTPAGAVLFCGESGAGKSTLLCELLSRGYPMLVDDVCSVKASEGQEPMVIPGYPRTRLWADSAKKLKIETTGLERTRPQMEKYERQVPEHFYNEPANINCIYILQPQNVEQVTLEPLPNMEKFSVVMHNTYRNIFLEKLDMRKSHFAMASMVASNTPMKKILRPRNDFKLTELADVVEADFTG